MYSHNLAHVAKKKEYIYIKDFYLYKNLTKINKWHPNKWHSTLILKDN